MLVIADEVMTGFGRTGKKFGVDHWGVTPDILVGGKGLTGGYAPMGAVFATRGGVAPIVAAGQELMFFTYSAHPASCAAADRVLQILEREALVARAATMGEKLGKRLVAAARAPERGRRARPRAPVGGRARARTRRPREPFPASARLTEKVVAAGIAQGIFVYPGGVDPARDVITLGPPFTISEQEIELIGERLERAIDGALERLH